MIQNIDIFNTPQRFYSSIIKSKKMNNDHETLEAAKLLLAKRRRQIIADLDNTEVTVTSLITRIEQYRLHKESVDELTEILKTE